MEMKPVAGTHTLAIQSGAILFDDFLHKLPSMPCKYESGMSPGLGFSPDGHLLAMLCADGLTLVDLTTAKKVLWRVALPATPWPPPSDSDALSKLAETRDIPPDQRRAIELLKDATGTYILMGSAADSVSYEASKYGEGLLTYALLEGMRGTALDDGSRLGVSRWFDIASERVPDLAKSVGGIQKPVIAAPRGLGFPVALLTKEDTAKIPLAMPKPQLLRVVCEDANQDDPLNLRDLLRERLRALNDVRARSNDEGDVQVMYIDATDDDMPGALAPKLLYTVTATREASECG